MGSYEDYSHAHFHPKSHTETAQKKVNKLNQFIW